MSKFDDFFSVVLDGAETGVAKPRATSCSRRRSTAKPSKRKP
jgi:hypothetical protein